MGTIAFFYLSFVFPSACTVGITNIHSYAKLSYYHFVDYINTKDVRNFFPTSIAYEFLFSSHFIDLKIRGEIIFVSIEENADR